MPVFSPVRFGPFGDAGPHTYGAADPPPGTRTGSGVVVVRVAAAVLPDPDEEDPPPGTIVALQAALAAWGAFPVVRLTGTVPPGRIRAWEAAAATSALPPLRSLLQYFLVDLRSSPSLVPLVIDAALLVPGVEAAYEAGNSEGPSPTPDFSPLQSHLDAAPDGVGADWLRANHPGIVGAGVRFADLERRWNVAHEDLGGPAYTVLYGDNAVPATASDEAEFNHGTATLGLVVAGDDGLGVLGLAPGVSEVGLISLVPPTSTAVQTVAGGIAAALSWLGAGDVLLIEEAYNGAEDPVETQPQDFDAIRLAVALGVTVVEPAGNLGATLDGLVTVTPDSGAVVASGACNVAATGNPPVYQSLGVLDVRFGARVDCWANAMGVVTTGKGDLQSTGLLPNTRWYTAVHGATSASSAIIAGVAVLLHQFARDQLLVPLSPLQMRELLRGPGTPKDATDAAAAPMGDMPDLDKIVTSALGYVPDVYVRDYVGDNGDPRDSGLFNRSPDIIVRPAASADPDADFGEASGTANDDTLADTVESGQDNSVYVRVRNRGPALAVGVTASVYWAPSSIVTSPTTQSWTLIGTTAPLDVPAGDTLVVFDRIVWAEALLPPVGHGYCLLAVIDCAGDPAPPVGAVTTAAEFLRFVSASNNVGWHNFSVVDNLANLTVFALAAPPFPPSRVDLEIRRRLPAGVRVSLELPGDLARAIGRASGWPAEPAPGPNGRWRLHLPALPGLVLQEVHLPLGVRAPARFVVQGDGIGPGHSITLRALHQGRSIGAVGFQVATPGVRARRKAGGP